MRRDEGARGEVEDLNGRVIDNIRHPPMTIPATTV
jgi:hypothetical protein